MNQVIKKGSTKFKNMAFAKYKPFIPVQKKNRKWPDAIINKAPVWCSVDLRDGNQALINPLTVEQKLVLFERLVEIGFKEIEVGFPAASSTEFEFIRRLIDNKLIPDDVTIQVLCQSRVELIDTTIKSLQGCKKAIFHLYNSTSSLQRKVVFNNDRAGIKNIALEGIKYLQQNLNKLRGTEVILEYSPESFTGTELDFTLDILQDVIALWGAGKGKKIILNLPATVELFTPNVYADMIEWIIEKLPKNDSIIVSLHTHNDRGTAVAATELALMAGAKRVEGTLFGNGERTGNVDIITLACNLYSQGIDPKLYFTSIDSLSKLCEELTEIEVNPRHPYAGKLVYTAFSGSHQDAIRKGIKALEVSKSKYWEVPYLPIDPADLGREYQPIRINSQSGKGGVAFILENRFGYQLPKDFHPIVSKYIQKISELSGKEVTAEEIKNEFELKLVNIENPFRLKDISIKHSSGSVVELNWQGLFNGEPVLAKSLGNGPIAAFVNSLAKQFKLKLDIDNYLEHTLAKEATAKAACYISLKVNDKLYYGVGVDVDTSRAALYAVTSAINNHFAV